MAITSPHRQLAQFEFVALMAMIMALTALSIDLMLPAFDEIRADFGLAADSTQTAGIVTSLFFGLAVAQLAYGPLADRFGRKPVLYGGFAIYAIGAVGSALAPTLTWLFVSRFIWGIGAAGGRVIVLAIVRDRYQGPRMARIMSFMVAVFVLVPILAPGLGALLLTFAPWRGLFWFCVVYVAAIAVWLTRLPESLDPSNRIPLSFAGVAAAARKVMTNRQTVGYTLVLTFLFGVFLSYLASSELIWNDVFGLGDWFPLIFGGLAVIMGGASLFGASIVGRLGVRRLVHVALLAYLTFAALLVLLAIATAGRPGFWPFVVLLAAALAMHALLIPNVNTMAMAPVGEVAGTASALIGSISMGFGALIGSSIDRAFNGTVSPFSVAFLVGALAAIGVVVITERGRLFERDHQRVPKTVPAEPPPA